jgi:integrase
MSVLTLSERTHAARPALGHTKRSAPGTLRDPQVVLAQLPIGTRDWRRALKALIDLHNYKHATKNKGVSFKTMHERASFLFRFFDDLHKLTKYKTLDPRSLATKHIEAMVRLWIERDLATATIHTYLSFLRTFGDWIGKRGLVRPVEYYVGTDSPHARRKQAAREDRSWSARDVDFAEVLERLQTLCPYVALQAEFSREFCMRPRETRQLRPHEAVLPREQATRRDPDDLSGATHYLRIKDGTKGGRPRDVPIETEVQWELIRRAQAIVVSGQYLGRPGRSLEANKRHYYRIMERAGITRSKRGVTPHGLRHQGANDKYQEIARAPSPVRGGTGIARALDREARQRVARVLGHNRIQVTNCYLGSSAVMRSKADHGPPSNGGEDSISP